MNHRAASRLTRRRLLRRATLAVGGSLAATILAACTPSSRMASAPGPTAETAGAAGSTAATQAGSQTTLTTIHWSSSPEDHQLFVDVFRAFEEQHPGTRVSFDDLPSDDFQQKALTLFVAGTPPDAMQLHPSWVLSFIKAGQLADLTNLAGSDRAAYVPAQLDYWTHDGKLYGAPYYSGPSFIYYNRTLFQRLGVKTPEQHEREGSWTWDTLQQLAQGLTTGHGVDRTFGWDAATDASQLQFYTCVPIWCNQGDLINADGTAWLVDTPPVVEVMQWHADLTLRDQAIPLPSDTQGSSWFFRTGRLGMAWAGRFRSLELVNADFEVGMVGTPRGKVGPVNRDGPNAVGLPTGTKHLDLAYKLATFIGGPDAAPIYLRSGRAIPVRTALFESNAFSTSLKGYERRDVLVEAARTVRAWRIPGRGAEALRALKTEWDKVLVGWADVPTALRTAKAAMDPLLVDRR